MKIEINEAIVDDIVELARERAAQLREEALLVKDVTTLPDVYKKSVSQNFNNRAHLLEMLADEVEKAE